MRVSADMPEDVRILHDALQQLRQYGHRPIVTSQQPLRLYLGNNGTALRFLQVHLQVCYPSEPIVLEGDPRLKERDGKPTSQTTSAWLLHGRDIPYEPGESPYITMTRKVMANYQIFKSSDLQIEADWSAAAFWYEYVAIHGGGLLLEGLKEESIQGDRAVATVYARYFGVETTFVTEGAVIKSTEYRIQNTDRITIDFTDFPDLYPAVALTCECLGIELKATGTERLRYKESDRLEAVRLHEVRGDHRMAMALLAACFPVSVTDQACIVKSYPQFASQMQSLPTVSRRSTDSQPTVMPDVSATSVQHITPRKGINDDNLGKKHALSKLIHAANTEYVWLHDDDVDLPEAAKEPNLTFPEGKEQNADVIILPLMMESEHEKPSLLEKLQIAEYAAIQELTMRTAKKNHAVLCSGANLIVRREVWLACEGEIHPEIASGDDMFLLEAVKRRGLKIGVLDEPEYTAIVHPQTTWRAFFRQRMRWAGKAPVYTDKDIRRCGALVLSANLIQILCPLIILIKFPIEYAMIRKRENKNKTTWYVALLLEIVYPFYILACLIGGLFRRKEW